MKQFYEMSLVVQDYQNNIQYSQMLTFNNLFRHQLNKLLVFGIKDQSKNKDWNNRSFQFWKKQQASYSGVLLGHEHLNVVDIDFSEKFIQKLFKKGFLQSHETVLDCGAGIGRVSKQLLCQYFTTIDTLEQTPQFVQKSKNLLKDVNVRNFYCQSLQQFAFENQYDCIWIQWTLTHLQTQDSINFLKKVKQNLKANGVAIIKQNISQAKKIIDYQDSTIIRTDFEWKRLFFQSQFKIIKQQFQIPWPKDLQKVKIYALI